MKNNLVDFESIRNKKLQDKIEEEEKKQKEEKQKKNEELFISTVTKSTLELTPDEMLAYQEVGVLCTFIVEDMYSMCITTFREQLYVLNHIGGKFEFLGKLEDVVSRGIFGGK